MLTLKTQRLTLREFNDADLPAYTQLRSGEKFQRFYSEDDCSSKRSKELLKLFITEAKINPRLHYQLAITTADQLLIGSCGLRITSQKARQASFGCELGEPQWGRGYATEASRTLIDYGFKVLGLHKIVVETISENTTAIATAKRSGFSVEAELRENHYFKNRWWNTTVLAILGSDWHANSYSKRR